jgi:Transposase DDE domain
VVALVLARRLQLSATTRPPALAAFRRVLVQDSTTLALNSGLAAHFPGAANAHGDTRGLLKIQVLYDLLSQQFVAFGLSGFRRNDQAAAQDVLPELRPGDLVLRDLGYFVVENLSRIAQAGAFFLSRLRLDVGLFDPTSQQSFDLLGRLKRQGGFDGEVCLGAARHRVRLVAVKLPEAVAAERRRKARQNRDRRCRPNARSLALLGWAIFVTNVSRKVWSSKTVAQVYGLRWRIETIFKTWKSHFRLTEVPRGSAAQLAAMIYARLIFVTMLAPLCAASPWRKGETTTASPLSLLKLAGLVADFFLILCLEASHRKISDAWLRQLNYHGRYEHRTRKHFVQTLMELS